MLQKATTRSSNSVAGMMLILSILSPLVLASPARADANNVELEFAARINEARIAVGLPVLLVQTKLIDEARSWSIKMREFSGQNIGPDCKLSHNPSLANEVNLAWKTLGENVACSAGDPAATHQALMESPQHRQNILDPKFDSVGIAVVMTGATMFVTEVFMQSKNPLVTATKQPRAIRLSKKKTAKSRRNRQAITS